MSSDDAREEKEGVGVDDEAAGGSPGVKVDDARASMGAARERRDARGRTIDMVSVMVVERSATALGKDLWPFNISKSQ